jgi:hypothetical protein
VSELLPTISRTIIRLCQAKFFRKEKSQEPKGRKVYEMSPVWGRSAFASDLTGGLLALPGMQRQLPAQGLVGKAYRRHGRVARPVPGGPAGLESNRPKSSVTDFGGIGLGSITVTVIEYRISNIETQNVEGERDTSSFEIPCS